MIESEETEHHRRSRTRPPPRRTQWRSHQSRATQTRSEIILKTRIQKGGDRKNTRPRTRRPLRPRTRFPAEAAPRSPARTHRGETPAPANPTDPGGTIDATATRGQTFSYTAQRVRSVTLNRHTLELRSSISQPVAVLMRDTFPPRAPSGLEAVPGGATAADRSIDLSWTPNTDADLAGYFVYRQEIGPNGKVTGSNQTP